MGNPVIPFTLSTERLRLREMGPSDLDFVSGMLADAEVMRHYPAVLSRMEAEEWIDRQLRRYRDDGHGLWLAEDILKGKPVGQVGLSMQEVDGTFLPELGYLIHRKYWRQGFATEAAEAVKNFAFTQFQYPRIISLIRPENTPSQGVARKIGMIPGQNTLHHDILHTVFSVSRA